jgi:hypothetical protein
LLALLPVLHVLIYLVTRVFIPQVGDFLAREKVSQAFRDALAPQYRSSKKFKHEKRRQRDKAAKLAKQTNLPEAGKDIESKPKGKSKASGSDPKAFVIKRSLSVLREEPPTPTIHPFAAAGTGAVGTQSNRPNRAMSLPQGQQSMYSQGYNNAYSGGMDNQMLGFQGYTSFGSPGMMHPRDSAAGPRVTNWHAMFTSANPTGIFNPIHSGNPLPSNMAAMSQHRRFSDSMMTDANQTPYHFHHQHHQHMPGDDWSGQQMPRLNPSALLSGANAALHASFPSGVNVDMIGMHPHTGTGVGMQRGLMGSGMTGQHAGLMNNRSAGASEPGMSSMQFEQQQRQHQGRASATRGARSSSLERTNSNVSTVSHSVVERLESSFTVLPQDENPFEPVPLPHERGDEVNKADDEEGSIVPDW